jgi:hypothetical protein
MKNVRPKELLAMVRRFRDPKEYRALKKSCQAAVTEWRWATSLMLPEVPHDEIVSGLKPSKWAKKQPRRYGRLHGLDNAGRIRCIRSDEGTKPDAEVTEQFLIHEDGGFWCINFGAAAKKTLLAVKWFERDGERWLRSLEIGPYGVHERVLVWEADRLVRLIKRHWESVRAGNAKLPGDPKLEDKNSVEIVSFYSYGADGDLDRVTEERVLTEGEPPWTEVKYQRIARGADLKSLLQEAEEMLVAEIPRTIRAAKVKETVYGLLVQFTGVDTDPCGFAPPLFLPSESLRSRLLTEHPKDAAWYLWAVPEWEEDAGVVTLARKHPALDEKLHQIFQLTVVQASPTNYGPVRKMFQRVCARLNAFNWPPILKTTDDFIVLPFDPHGELDAAADLKASVPA